MSAQVAKFYAKVGGLRGEVYDKSTRLVCSFHWLTARPSWARAEFSSAKQQLIDERPAWMALLD